MASRIIYVSNPYLNFLSLNTYQLATELKNKFILGLLNLKNFKQIKNNISLLKNNNYSAFSTLTLSSLSMGLITQFILSPSSIPKASATSFGKLVLNDEYLGLTRDTFVVFLIVIMPPIFLFYSINIYRIMPFIIYIFLYYFCKYKANIYIL